MRCSHRKIEVKTERDRCSWVCCLKCGKTGPAKHSYTLALIAWALHLTNQHPRKPKNFKTMTKAQLYGKGPSYDVPARITNPFKKKRK